MAELEYRPHGWPQARRFVVARRSNLYTIRRMRYASTRWTLLAVLCYSTPAIGQIVGRFYLEKNTFALGEPVFLNFEVSNSGREPEDIIRADPYSFCAGYEIHLSSDPSPWGHLSALCVSLLPLSVAAQETPKVEVFGGYSHLQLTEQSRILLKSGSLNGWNASVKLNVMPRIGLLADFSSHYGQRGLTPFTINSLTTPGELTRVEATPDDMRQHMFLFGPEVRLLRRDHHQCPGINGSGAHELSCAVSS